MHLGLCAGAIGHERHLCQEFGLGQFKLSPERQGLLPRHFPWLISGSLIDRLALQAQGARPTSSLVADASDALGSEFPLLESAADEGRPALPLLDRAERDGSGSGSVGTE
jgi:hypothetical protein